MATDERWYFTKEQLISTPSRRCGIDADKELSFRQQAANFIQDMGQRLVVTQLCINTAIVYMHRFYLFHSLTHFPRNSIAAAALFLAAKVEEQPRKLEHVIKMSHMCLHRGEQAPPDVRSEQYLEQAQDLVFNENVLLQTLGFDVAIDHPHTHVVRLCQLVKASKDLAQTSYFMASNSLHLTTMCLQYKPTVVACFCIHLACKWSNWEIPQSNEGKHWFWYVDKSVTSELLQQLTAEFLHIFDKCPSRLKRKIMSISASQSPSINHPSLPNSPFDVEPRKIPSSSSTESGPSFHSNRSHHLQEKQEEKKVPTTVSSRSSIDYREYREKKERIEREKASTSTTTAQSHIVDIKKHHSHHHKPASVTAPNKHQLLSIQKGTNLHHNNHRPDMKVGQTVQPRHSAISRELNRDVNRQRLQREYNAGIGSTSTNITHLHGHISHQTKGSNLDNSLSDSGSHRADIVSMTDSVSHSNLQEKLSNNNHNVHRPNTLDNKHQAHDKRIYDPRHKSIDYRKDSEQKTYGKYPDTAKVDRQQKTDMLEQKSEEVRKLIEKSLTLPKLTDLPYMMSVQKQAHHAKYQTDKLQGSTALSSSDMKHPSIAQNAFSQGKSPTTVACSPQILQKSTLKNIQNQHTTQGVSQILKDTVKNGGPQSCLASSNNMDDFKSEKRSRYDDCGKNSINIQQNVLNAPPGKHRSLFSPEKTSTSKDSHMQRPKSKQKTSPAVRVKQERGLETPLGFHMLSPPFASPHLQQQDSSSMKRSSYDTISHKKRLANTSDNEQAIKIKLEDTLNLATMKMLGCIPPELRQLTDDKQSSNECRNSTPFVNDSKPSILFEPDSLVPQFNTATQPKILSMNLQTLTNGLDSNITIKEEPLEYSNMKIKQEPVEHSNITIKQEPLEHSNVTIKQESLDHHMKKESYRTSDIVSIKSEYSHPQVKVEYTSPIKSALSISALLQEPLAPMPSLLQGMQQFNEIQEQHIARHTILLTDSQSTLSSQCLSVSTASDNLDSIASTVDISALSCVPMTQQSSMEETLIATSISPLTVNVPTKEKRSEHHKSEKKKKEKKHKHKDKEKSKEKHKHKHKDKDKEKHREKEKDKNEETSTTVPIRITIPKDKLNLGTDTTSTAISGSVVVPDKNKSPQSTGLKIKIPKERLKGTDNATSSPAQSVVHGPLRIKIRTDGISRNSATASLNGSSGANLNDQSEIGHNNRKRFDLIDNSTTSGPPLKKQSLTPATSYSQHRSGERQNGRHYSSGSNNKVRGGGRGARQHIGRGPPPLAGYYVTTDQRDDYYQRDNYSNSNNHARNQSQTHPPPVHGDTAYLRNSNVGQTQADPYFFANYPPPSVYNPAGYIYNPATYYQQYQEERQHQQQYPMYSAGNLIITPDGTIDTSVPPPLLLPNIHQGQNVFHQQMTASSQQKSSPSFLPPPPPPPPLPSGPPPDSSPPPPPPPPE